MSVSRFLECKHFFLFILIFMVMLCGYIYTEQLNLPFDRDQIEDLIISGGGEILDDFQYREV